MKPTRQYTRKAMAGDPPPADPPHPDFAWEPWNRMWMESDAALRKRIFGVDRCVHDEDPFYCKYCQDPAYGGTPTDGPNPFNEGQYNTVDEKPDQTNQRRNAEKED